MTPRDAVCYVASDGYLFQTLTSALQAKHHLPVGGRVIIVHVGEEPHDERHAFESACDDLDIEFIGVPRSLIGRLHFAYARLFLDEILPAEIEDILYLDGDTQIHANLSPLMAAEPPDRGVLAAKDPMVLISGTASRLGRHVHSWWDESDIPLSVRPRYINSGVLRVRRRDLGAIRSDVLDLLRTKGSDPRFLDQDLINIALGDRVATISIEWNFPGFLLDTRIAAPLRPKITHFMSDPRPWEAPYGPWGHTFFDPYRSLSLRHPELARYWSRASGARRLRYEGQQLLKRVVERPVYQSRSAAAAFALMVASDTAVAELPIDPTRSPGVRSSLRHRRLPPSD